MSVSEKTIRELIGHDDGDVLDWWQISYFPGEEENDLVSLGILSKTNATRITCPGCEESCPEEILTSIPGMENAPKREPFIRCGKLGYGRISLDPIHLTAYVFHKQVFDQYAENAGIAISKPDPTPATGPWRTDEPPRDGSWILALFRGLPYVVVYDSWEVGGEMLSDGTGSPHNEHESGWCLAGDSLQVMDQDDPEKWAEINLP